MPKSKAPLVIGYGIAAVALLAFASKGKPKKQERSLPDLFNTAMHTPMCELAAIMYAEGQTISAETLAMRFLSESFPDVDWAASQQDSDLAAVVQTAVAKATAILSDDTTCAQIFPASTLEQQAVAIFEAMRKPTPTPGAFYRVQPGDTVGSILTTAATAAGSPLNANNLMAYGQCLSSGVAWNARLYLRPSTPITNPNDAAIYTEVSAGGIAQNIDLAFMPQNPPVLDAIEQAKFPRANATYPDAAPLEDDARGVLWLPPIQLTEQGEILTCGQLVWSDGTSSIDPPPEFLDLLNAAALSSNFQPTQQATLGLLP